MRVAPFNETFKTLLVTNMPDCPVALPAKAYAKETPEANVAIYHTLVGCVMSESTCFSSNELKIFILGARSRILPLISS